VINVNFDEISTNPDLQGCQFDVIYANDCFLHSIDKSKMINEISKLMKPDAILVFSDILEHQNSDKEMLKTIYHRLNLDHLATADQYMASMEQSGLKKIDVYFET
jgi:2-polyprenyl-3-methyl-5-hydroxy-6-metoxy-1,4-benzoquinol methylase